MTKKNFELIADCIREEVEAQQREGNVDGVKALAHLVHRFEARLRVVNPAFKPNVFRERSGVA